MRRPSTKPAIPWETLVALELARLILPWYLPTGPAFTLSPLAAERLGLVIFERGRDEDPYWTYPGDVPQQVWRKRGRGTDYLMTMAELVVDPTPGPEYLIDEADGEPMEIWGMKITRDRRMKAGISVTPVKSKPATRPKPKPEPDPAFAEMRAIFAEAAERRRAEKARRGSKRPKGDGINRFDLVALRQRNDEAARRKATGT